MSWVPMDIAANAILETAFSKNPAPIVMNIVHPRPISWKTSMMHVRDAIGALSIRRQKAQGAMEPVKAKKLHFIAAQEMLEMFHYLMANSSPDELAQLRLVRRFFAPLALCSRGSRYSHTMRVSSTSMVVSYVPIRLYASAESTTPRLAEDQCFARTLRRVRAERWRSLRLSLAPTLRDGCLTGLARAFCRGQGVCVIFSRTSQYYTSRTRRPLRILSPSAIVAVQARAAAISFACLAFMKLFRSLSNDVKRIPMARSCPPLSDYNINDNSLFPLSSSVLSGEFSWGWIWPRPPCGTRNRVNAFGHSLELEVVRVR